MGAAKKNDVWKKRGVKGGVRMGWVWRFGYK
jgi:hypothetical protein